MLADHEPPPIDDAIDRELRAFIDDRRCPMPDGRWPMADGRWPMADARWLVPTTR